MMIARLLLVLLLMACITAPLTAQSRLKLATTTSTNDSGLLDVLLPPFEKRHNVRVDVIAVGTGKALKIAENGDVDVVMVHARNLEEQFVANGFGVDRKDVMYNDFVIVGPEEDPAGIKGIGKAAEAVRRIAEKQSIFVSRGDESGTHQKEKSLWAAASIEPSGAWYQEIGQGMGAALRISDEKQAYCLVDRGTFLALRQTIDLVVLTEGDPMLFNPYGIIAVSPKKWPHVEYTLARALIDWVTSEQGRKIIADYKKHGEVLFTPTGL